MEDRLAEGALEGIPAAPSQFGGKYMTFQLAREVYGLEILAVQEIIGLLQITRVPLTPDFIRGVINLRGRVVPAIDLRLKFGMEAVEATEQTVVIVVQYQVAGRALTMGVLVDLVLEVLSIEASQIEPPPDLGYVADGDFIRGVGKAGDRVVFLLDIAKALSSLDVAALGIAAQAS